MSWREELQPASFRGVPFEVQADSGTFGRRGQTHEYPQRDKPWTEDLGRATRNFELTAFLIGDDYLARRDALLGAIEAEGPGLLVHPWYGELTVNVKDPGARVSHSNANGGMCEIALTFVEAGELEFPVAADSLGAQSLEAADALGLASIDDFAGGMLDGLPSFSLDGLPSFSLDGLPSFALDSLLGDIDLFGGLLDAAGGALDFLDFELPDWAASALSAAGDVLGLVDQARAFATGVMGMFPRAVLPTTRVVSGRGAGSTGSISTGVGTGGISTGVGAGGSNARFTAAGAGAAAVVVMVPGAAKRNRNAVLALTSLSQQYGTYVVAPTSAAPATRQVQANRAAVAQLFQRSMLVQAAGMASAMTMPVYDDAVLVRNSIAAAAEAASFDAADTVYVPLQVLRTRVHADINARLSQSARLLDYTPRQVMPGLALAYDLHEDVGREEELIDRNALRHPGFVPARVLKVLSA